MFLLLSVECWNAILNLLKIVEEIKKMIVWKIDQDTAYQVNNFLLPVHSIYTRDVRKSR